MERLTSHMNRNDVAAASDAARVYTHLHRRLGKKVLFVYDLVAANDSDFDTLRFTLDAVRPPRSSALFEKLYGLPRYLKFEKSSRRAPASVDMWEGIYC